MRNEADLNQDETIEESLDRMESVEIQNVSMTAIGAITKSEVGAQLDAAHQYKRGVKKFVNEATSLATLTHEIAMSCMYSLPRGQKKITGPSVRLAEICASAYGNLHVGARVVGIEDKEIIAQGIAWDLEKNLRATIEVRRRITDSKGKRYNDDMITMTGNAAASIALRNAIFRVIPRAYIDVIYQKAKDVAIGNAFTLSETRAKVIERLLKLGALQDRILAKVGRISIEEITLEDVELLVGFGTAIRNGDATVDETFPPVGDPTKGKVDLNALKTGTEANRGHGNEGLDAVKQGAPEKTETLEQQRARKAAEAETKQSESETKTENTETAGAPDPEAPLTKEQSDRLDSIRLHQNIEPKTWNSWIRSAFDIKLSSQLRNKHFGRALAWCEAGGQEQTDANQ